MNEKKMNLDTIIPVFEANLLAEIENIGTIREVKKGDILVDLGEQIKFIPLIVKGSVKVVREDEN